MPRRRLVVLFNVEDTATNKWNTGFPCVEILKLSTVITNCN